MVLGAPVAAPAHLWQRRTPHCSFGIASRYRFPQCSFPRGVRDTITAGPPFPRVLSPVWLEEWLDGGARPNRAECSSAGPSGYENRCPRVGDVWELLELLLGWWAERICAVAGGFPMWSGQAAVAEGEAAAAVGVTGAAIGGGATGQQQRRGGGWGRQGGDGIGSLASVTTRAVESVQVNESFCVQIPHVSTQQ